MQSKILAILFWTLSAASAVGATVEEVFLGSLDAPRELRYADLSTPTPTLLLYQDGRCTLVVNTAVAGRNTGIGMVVSVAHEVGHCIALRAGLQVVSDGTTRFGESFADVYALAWVRKNKAGDLSAATAWLINQRLASRRISFAYDTVTAIRLAAAALAEVDSNFDPEEWTTEFFKP